MIIILLHVFVIIIYMYILSFIYKNISILYNVGIRNQKLGKAYRYDEELVVPIIENTPFEEDLKDELEKAIIAYPETCAVLVRRHGVYVWGDTWQQAKTMYVLI